MLLELHNPPKKQPPAGRSVTPCLSPGMKWLIPPQSSVHLLCGKGEAVTPISGHLLPGSLFYSQCQSGIPGWDWVTGRISAWNFTSSLFFWYNSVSVIDCCKKCCQTLVLLLTVSFCSGHTHPPQQFPVCCLHPINLLLSQHPKNLNNCQSHEQALIISRLYSTTAWCLQLQLNVMHKEEKAGTSSHVLQLHHVLGGVPSKFRQSSLA